MNPLLGQLILLRRPSDPSANHTRVCFPCAPAALVPEDAWRQFICLMLMGLKLSAFDFKGCLTPFPKPKAHSPQPLAPRERNGMLMRCCGLLET